VSWAPIYDPESSVNCSLVICKEEWGKQGEWLALAINNIFSLIHSMTIEVTLRTILEGQF